MFTRGAAEYAGTDPPATEIKDFNSMVARAAIPHIYNLPPRSLIPSMVPAVVRMCEDFFIDYSRLLQQVITAVELMRAHEECHANG